MATKTVAASPSNQQIALTLNDIANCARSIQRFVIQQNWEEDERDAAAQRYAIEALAERIGFLADFTAASIPGFEAVFNATAEGWMLPPLWHGHEKAIRPEEAAA